jgi:hypothetical protein
MTYKKDYGDFWVDDDGVIWKTITFYEDDWRFVLRRVNSNIEIEVHGSRFEKE